MPVDDNALETWLKEQPGVAPWTVHTRRKGDQLEVMFIMSQNAFLNPPCPDLEQITDCLGYSPPTTWIDVGPDK